MNFQGVAIINALEKYEEREISLRELVSNIENALDRSSDQDLKDGIFDHLVALEEVYAHTRMGGFDFEKDGRSVVDRAIREIRRTIDAARRREFERE